MTMFKRYFHLLRSYNRICVNYHSISYRLIEHCLEKKKYTSFNDHNIQRLSFYGSVANPLPLSINTLESKVINLCIQLRNGRTFFDDIEQIIQIYEETDHELKNDVSLMLLKCCGELLPDVDVKEKRILTKRVWNLIQNKDCELTLEHYNILLSVYAQNYETINPHEFLDNMKVKPDESIYRSLLNVISKIEDHDLVSSIILKIEENINSWSKETFDAVIEAYAMQSNITEAYKMIQKMQSLGIMPSSETYFCLVYGFAKMGDITNIVQTFEKNQPSIGNLMKVIKIISLYGHGKHIPSILKFLPVQLKEDELFIINNTIIELTHSGQREEALKIITELPKDAEITDACIEYIKCFVNKEIQLNISDKDILQVVRELMHNKRSSQIINKATEVALSHGKESLALALFEHMKKDNIPVRSHYYWPLLLQAHKHSAKNKLYFLISHMISLDVDIDYDTLIEYTLPFADATDPVTTIKALINTGIDYPIAIKCVNAFLLQNNKLKEVMSVCSTFKVKLDFRESCLENSLIEGYKKRTSTSTYVPLMLQIPYTNDPPFVYILNALLNNTNHSKELEEFIDFLRTLKKYNTKISKTDIELIKRHINEITMDTATNEIIKNLLNEMNDETICLNYRTDSTRSVPISVLSPFPHPKKMDSEELQNHIVELKNKNMNTRGSTKKLLKEYCLQNDLKNAEELKQNIIENGFEWTPGMSAYLFDLYVKKNMLDKAEIELSEIQNNFVDFQIDNVKVLSYATCLVKNNRLEDAFNAINNIKNVNKRINGNTKCFHLLTHIANSEHYNSTEKMLETLVKNNYCNINNVLLIPLIQRHLSNDDIESAIGTFIYYAKKYKQTPLKQKILLTLIKNIKLSTPGNKERLKRVIKSISDVYGEPVAIVHLISALAETGQVLKLQEVFQTQEVEMKLLVYHLRNYVTNENVHMLLTLFEVVKDRKNISIGPLCDLILSVYEQNNDCQAAVTFLRKMEEAHITQSAYFKRTFRNLVANKKHEMLQ